MSELELEKHRNVILLSAGSGSRMGKLTTQHPKSLLNVGQKTVIDWMLEAILKRITGEVIVVTGFQASTVVKHLEQHYGPRIKTVHNPYYADDVNILSVEMGVSALSQPEDGYLIIETDLLLDENAWDKVFFAEQTSASYWVCKGKYSQQLTGGIVKSDVHGDVLAIDYQPEYSGFYDGWAKMVGLLYVAPSEVNADRKLRQEAISNNIRQYYLMPWCKYLEELPCRVLDLAESFAVSFNTKSDFYTAVDTFLTLNVQTRDKNTTLQEEKKNAAD